MALAMLDFSGWCGKILHREVQLRIERHVRLSGVIETYLANRQFDFYFHLHRAGCGKLGTRMKVLVGLGRLWDETASQLTAPLLDVELEHAIVINSLHT